MTILSLICLGAVASVALLNVVLLVLEWFISIVLDLILIARSKPHNLELVVHDVRAILTKVLLTVSFAMTSPKQIGEGNKKISQIIQVTTKKYLRMYVPEEVTKQLRKTDHKGDSKEHC